MGLLVVNYSNIFTSLFIMMLKIVIFVLCVLPTEAGWKSTCNRKNRQAHGRICDGKCPGNYLWKGVTNSVRNKCCNTCKNHADHVHCEINSETKCHYGEGNNEVPLSGTDCVHCKNHE